MLDGSTLTKQTESRISIAMFMISSAWFFALVEGRSSLKVKWNHFKDDLATFNIGNFCLLLRGSSHADKAVLDRFHLEDVIFFFAPELDILPTL